MKRRRSELIDVAEVDQESNAIASLVTDRLRAIPASLPDDLATLPPRTVQVVMLGVIDNALRALVEEGIVVRMQGSGTFVAESRKPMDRPWHCRFLDDSGERFLPLYTKVVARQRIAERGPWSDHLVPRGGEVIRIDRVINVNDEFPVYSQFYVDAGRFGSLLTRPASALDGANLKIIISREFGLPVTSVAQTMSTVRFPDAVRRALKLRRTTDSAGGSGPGERIHETLIMPGQGRVRIVYAEPAATRPRRRTAPPP